jgi:DNA modification methylase
MSTEVFLNGRAQLCRGDGFHFLRDQPSGRYDSVVTDPPYALVSITKRFGSDGAAACRVPETGTGAYARASAGFMGKKWDTGETAFSSEFWAEVLRVLKPGGHVAAFGGTRTYHRLACAIEDAGFEIRDSVQWLYGSGFPKSHDVAKGLGKQLAGPALRAEWEGWGTALKPAVEPICLARKPLVGTVAANVLQHGTGAINIDGCRVHADDAQGGEYTVTRLKPGATLDKTGGNWRPEDVLYHGEMKPGRWPANVIHDGSEEVLAAFPDAAGQQAAVTGSEPSSKTNAVYGEFNGRPATEPRGDTGSAARFFYTAKADADDRIGSKHPTVKPVDLMQWLVRLITPKGGLVLDPFAGTGTTAEACFREGMRCMMVEREPEYQADIRRRMSLVLSGPDERARESIKAKLAGKPIDLGPLFAETAG